MCKKCDDLRRQIAGTRIFSSELTDPISMVLNESDIKTLEEKLIKLIAGHHRAEK
jgi:hypothetical protein